MNEQVVNVRLIALNQQRIPVKKYRLWHPHSYLFSCLGTLYKEVIRKLGWYIPIKYLMICNEIGTSANFILWSYLFALQIAWT